MLRADLLDPDAGRLPLSENGYRWLRERDLKARTREEYARHLRLHVVPYLGSSSLRRRHIDLDAMGCES
jgi:hypothetical protein